MTWRWRFGGAAWLLASCAQAAPGLLDFSDAERAHIASHGPWPVTRTADVANGIEQQPEAIALGRRLFFDKRLSADGKLACASCHVPQRAFQDGVPVPAARSRVDGQAGHRNTPSLLDAAQRRWLGWDGAHDSLWSASLAPLLVRSEMGHDLATLAAHVRRDADLRHRMQRVFPGASDDDEVLAVNVAKALAAWQATLVSARTPFDRFRDALLRGDRHTAARYPLAAQRGLRLFIGRARCSVCHSGPHFSNGEFADIGVPFFVPGGVDPGRHGGLARLLASPHNRLGPYNDAPATDERAVLTRHVVVEHRHFGEFRVPGLRQLRHTAPYMHNGSLPTLQAVVRHYSELDEERLHADGERILRRLDLSPGEAADLLAFLQSLSSATPAAQATASRGRDQSVKVTLDK